MQCALCDKKGKYYVTFTAYGLGQARLPRNKVTARFNIMVCESHAKTMKKEDLINKSGWESIQQGMLSKGKALLDSSTVELQLQAV